MPCVPPAVNYNGTPCRYVLPAGTQLYRVHRQKRPAVEFSPVVAHMLYGGGRFDPVSEDKYPYLYAAFSVRTALAEVLLRSLPFNDRGARLLPRAAVKERRLSSVTLTTDITLIGLTTSAELAAIGQDEWLIHADSSAYPQTRDWSRWLRHQASWAQGLVWPSKRDVGEKAVILFGDRCQPGDLRPGGEPPVDLDDHLGYKWLNEMLASYRVTIRPPVNRAH
jgi:hypothetical protein